MRKLLVVLLCLSFAAFADDKISSSAPVTGSYTPNLHSIWDTNMIAVYSGNKKGGDVDEATSGMADTLLTKYKSQIASEVSKTIDFRKDLTLFTGWANDAHALAASASYGKMPSDIPVNSNPQTLKSCSGVSDQFVNLGEVADKDFVDSTQLVIEKQLAMGGARLASILNSVWP